MSTYYGKARTNYFEITDLPRFESFLSRFVDADGNSAQLISRDFNGVKKYGFYVTSSPQGFLDENGDYNFDGAMEELKGIVRPGDACILIETGYEKMRYLVGSASIVTSKDFKYITIEDAAKDIARGLLGDPGWDTETSY